MMNCFAAQVPIRNEADGRTRLVRQRWFVVLLYIVSRATTQAYKNIAIFTMFQVTSAIGNRIFYL